MRPRVRFGLFLAGGLVVAALLAFFVSPQASSEPDGLERVTEDESFIEGAEDHALAGAPTADYGVAGIDESASAPAWPACSGWPSPSPSPAACSWCCAAPVAAGGGDDDRAGPAPGPAASTRAPT